VSEFPYGFDGLWAGLGNEDDGAAFVAERDPHLVSEIFFVLLGKEFFAVDEKEKSWRRLSDLRSVKKFEAMAQGTHRLATLDGVIQSAIQDRSRNFLLQLGGDVTDRFEESIEMETGNGGGEDDGGVIEKEKVFLHPFAEFGQGGHELRSIPVFSSAALDFLLARFANGFFHQIPFVYDDDAGFAFFDDFIGDFFVLFSDAGFGVKHENGNVATGDGIFRAFDAKEFDGIIDAAGFAHASGIDE
jgi:hypothetical protein